MAVFRVEKTTGYTVMSNFHLRDKNLSCRACGLLSKMLSLPEEWDYTTRGLAMICKDGVDAITTTLKELEACGYLIRRQNRDDKGRMAGTEFVIFEHPQKEPVTNNSSEPIHAVPDTGAPCTGIPDTEAPYPVGAAQINKELTSTEESSTEKSIKDSRSFVPVSPSVHAREDADDDWSDEPVKKSEEDGEGQTAHIRADGLTDLSPERARERIREQIEYDVLRERVNPVQLDELVEIMLGVMLNRSPTIHLSREEEYPTAYVQDRYRKITAEHIETVFESIRENSTRVINTKAYLQAALFNAVSTMDHHYAMMANADLYGGG